MDRPAAIRKSPRARDDEARHYARRAAILGALQACILRNGYSDTSLSDIAAQAGMSPSHIFYYFKGKREIINQCFHIVSEQRLRAMRASLLEAPNKQLAQFSAVILADDEVGRRESAFMVECDGLAAHNAALRVRKTAYDQQVKSILEQILRSSFGDKKVRAGPEEKNLLAVCYALLVGLCVSTHFSDAQDHAGARAKFSAAVCTLSGTLVERY